MKFRAALLLPFLLGPAAAAGAGEWVGCANKTHALDVLVDPQHRTVLGFGLIIHGVKQDQISWDLVPGTLDPATRALSFSARERSTAQREFTLSVRESSGSFRWRTPRTEPAVELACFWGTPGI